MMITASFSYYCELITLVLCDYYYLLCNCVLKFMFKYLSLSYWCNFIRVFLFLKQQTLELFLNNIFCQNCLMCNHMCLCTEMLYFLSYVLPIILTFLSLFNLSFSFYNIPYLSSQNEKSL